MHGVLFIGEWLSGAEAVGELLLNEQVVWSTLILAVAALIQSTVGFAAALFGLPLLLWAGNDLVTAQVLILTAMMPQNLFSVWKLRREIRLREVIAPALIRIAALPIGIAGLAFVLTWSAAGVHQLVGVIILLAVAMQALVGIEWKSAQRWYWMVVTFGGSGILQGLSGTSAPPMVLWVHGQKYSADRARAFLFSMFITNFVPQILLLQWKFGGVVWHAMGLSLLSIPLVLLAAMLGLRLGSWLGDRWLRPISYVCLIILAMGSLLDPWWHGSIYPWLQSLVSSLP